jgi:replication factor C small subunit
MKKPRVKTKLTKQRENVWSEDFRPKKLEDIKGQPAIAVLQAFVKRKNVVDCCLIGPPGTGKTTAVEAMAMELYGYKADVYGKVPYDSCFMRLNASDERGIETVRTTIKDFTTRAPDDKVGFLVCFLDEADRLTPEAQDALKSTIEAHSNNCRFIFSCNNPDGLTEALLSRGPIIPFFKLEDKVMKEIISNVCIQKGLEIHDEAVDRLVYVSRGDIRSMMKKLQIASMMLTAEEPVITKEILNKFIYQADDLETKKILEFAFNKDFSSARENLKNLYKSHYDEESILSSIERVMEMSEKSFPNEIAYWTSMALIGDCRDDIKKSSNPMNSIMVLMWKMVLTIQMPVNCIHVKV